jgi:endoglucanase
MKPWSHAPLGALLLAASLMAWVGGVALAAPLLTAAEWQSYKTHFISPEGRVMDTGNHRISHSEGQGYGLLLALAAEDRATFEALWGWTQKHLQRVDGLFGWKWDPNSKPPVQDWNNATDGDLLIAWALARAGERWNRPEWVSQARVIAERVRTTLIVSTAFGPALLPAQYGFKEGANLTLNPSYWVFPAFRALARIDPHPVWQELTQSGLALLARTRFGPHQVPSDWVILHADSHLGLSPEPARRRMGFDAIRIPLYLCWADLNDPVLMQGFLQAWPSDDAPAWVDLATGDRAAYPLRLAQRVVRHLVSACTNKSGGPRPRIEAQDYYGSTLSLLSQIALSRSKALP